MTSFALDGPCQAVLFDLDGTLADTAPDLAAAANKMRRARGLEAMSLDDLRPLASAGARGLLEGAFGIGPEHHTFIAMRDEFLANYETALCIETTLFPGMSEVLDELDERQQHWGIVTNKVARFTLPLIEQLGLGKRAKCVVSGDTTPHPKPHPAPLLYAAQQLNLAPEHIMYVGDDLRDIQAGAAAGMLTTAAAYGYCGTQVPPTQWQARYVVQSIRELSALLKACSRP